MEKSMKKGTIFTLLSALTFGITPMFTSLSYTLGSNSMTITFYRNAMAVPAILLILLIMKIKIKIPFKQFLEIGIFSGVFSVATTYLLMDSYNYIGIGLATTLHFLYPIFTVLIGRLFFKTKLDWSRAVALILATSGIAVASGGANSVAMKGIIMAVASAITFAIYMVGLERTSAGKMNSMVAMMYMCLANTVVVVLIDIPMGEIIYALSPKAFLCTAIVALGNSALGYVLLMVGIKLIGAGNAAIYSMLEPVFGVIMGVIFLGEGLPLTKFISCALVLVGVVIPMIRDLRCEKECLAK